MTTDLKFGFENFEEHVGVLINTFSGYMLLSILRAVKGLFTRPVYMEN